MLRPGHCIHRRTALTALLVVPIAGACGSPSSPPAEGSAIAELEDRYDVRLGVSAVHTRTGREVRHRPDERFGMCSTFKTYAVAALLNAHPLNSEFFRTVVHFTRADIVAHSPVTEAHVDVGMNWFDLCEAALTHSDNTAANLILGELGGPRSIGRFASSLGDTATRLDRWEPELNDVAPGDERDTTTPAAIATGYRALLAGGALRRPERDQLASWLIANTTGRDQLRAGLPAHWRTGDKTGGGFYGRLNDIAVSGNTSADLLVIAAMSDRTSRDADTDAEMMADLGGIIARKLG